MVLDVTWYLKGPEVDLLECSRLEVVEVDLHECSRHEVVEVDLLESSRP